MEIPRSLLTSVDQPTFPRIDSGQATSKGRAILGLVVGAPLALAVYLQANRSAKAPPWLLEQGAEWVPVLAVAWFAMILTGGRMQFLETPSHVRLASGSCLSSALRGWWWSAIMLAFVPGFGVLLTRHLVATSSNHAPMSFTAGFLVLVVAIFLAIAVVQAVLTDGEKAWLHQDALQLGVISRIPWSAIACVRHEGLFVAVTRREHPETAVCVFRVDDCDKLDQLLRAAAARGVDVREGFRAPPGALGLVLLSLLACSAWAFVPAMVPGLHAGYAAFGCVVTAALCKVIQEKIHGQSLPKEQRHRLQMA